MTTSRVRVAISLGSNEDDRAQKLRFARACLEGLLSEVRFSSIFETAPLHVADQPAFLNACCTGMAEQPAMELLTALKDVEIRAGRDLTGPRYGPRPLDLDLLLYGDLVIDEPGLTIPHARMRERAFVLVPLAELAPDWVVPPTLGFASATVHELASVVGSRGVRQMVPEAGQ